jgi:hypothetical protein
LREFQDEIFHEHLVFLCHLPEEIVRAEVEVHRANHSVIHTRRVPLHSEKAIAIFERKNIFRVVASQNTSFLGSFFPGNKHAITRDATHFVLLCCRGKRSLFSYE